MSDTASSCSDNIESCEVQCKVQCEAPSEVGGKLSEFSVRVLISYSYALKLMSDFLIVLGSSLLSNPIIPSVGKGIESSLLAIFSSVDLKCLIHFS